MSVHDFTLSRSGFILSGPRQWTFSWSMCGSLIWVSLIPFFLVIYIIFLDVTTKEARFRKTILKRTQERSVNSTNDQFRFHTLQNFHLTFDLRQLSKISSFNPFLSIRKNVSTAAFSPKMRNKLRGWRFGPSIWAHQKMTFVDLNFETFIKNHLSQKLKDFLDFCG